jgi:hypothetical protein
MTAQQGKEYFYSSSAEPALRVGLFKNFFQLTKELLIPI